MFRLLLLALCLMILNQCSTKSSHGASSYEWIAWNEDTVQSTTLAVYKDGYFVYRIKTATHTDVAVGKIAYSDDTLYLKYKQPPPTSMSNYLVREATGHYWIQMASETHARIVMRIRGGPLY